ncbi:hypothetical protein G6694_09745, partial [Polynucleobacter paneuropaeus]|nr:hypothetical protein [Polynucleobacter paneuropaeus]
GVAQAGSFISTPSAAVMGVGSANNYSFTYVPATNTVAKANVTYTGSITNTTYNANTQSASNTYTLGGVVGSDSGQVSVSATAATGTNAATYVDSNAVLSLTGSAAGNYQLASTGNAYGTLVIGKANLALTATASLTGNIYNGSAYTGTYTTTFLGSDASHV